MKKIVLTYTVLLFIVMSCTNKGNNSVIEFSDGVEYIIKEDITRSDSTFKDERNLVRSILRYYDPNNSLVSYLEISYNDNDNSDTVLKYNVKYGKISDMYYYGDECELKGITDEEQFVYTNSERTLFYFRWDNLIEEIDNSGYNEIFDYNGDNFYSVTSSEKYSFDTVFVQSNIFKTNYNNDNTPVSQNIMSIKAKTDSDGIPLAKSEPFYYVNKISYLKKKD